MSTAEERMRILQMIQEGKVTPEEGAKKPQGRGFQRGAEYFGGNDHA